MSFVSILHSCTHQSFTDLALAFIYIFWNNGSSAGQSVMGFWLKSFNKKVNPPVPGVEFSVSDINQLPLVTTGIFIGMALTWAWLSDGPFRGARWPFIYAGAVIAVSSCWVYVEFSMHLFALFMKWSSKSQRELLGSRKACAVGNTSFPSYTKILLGRC